MHCAHGGTRSLPRPHLPLPLSPSEWAQEVIRLAILYKDQGVVGVDIAGDELQPFDPYIPHFKVERLSVMCAGPCVLSRRGLV